MRRNYSIPQNQYGFFVSDGNICAIDDEFEQESCCSQLSSDIFPHSIIRVEDFGRMPRSEDERD